MLVKTVCYTSYAFSYVVIICEMGERMSNAFDEIGDLVWQTQWYLYSNEIQQLLPTIMIAVQKPAAIKFFGSLSCNRESLEKVIYIYQKNHSKISTNSI